MNTNDWIPFQSANCQTCKAHCCSYLVALSPEELQRIKAINPDGVEENRGILKQIGGRCFFLTADNWCSIYEQRPDVCADFPAHASRPDHCPYELDEDK